MTPFVCADDAEACIGSVVLAKPSEIRWTHGTIQPLFTCGRPLKEVVDQLRNEQLLPSDLPMIELVSHMGKWYSRNNRRLWCFKQSGLPSIEVRIGKADHYFLKGLSTSTDGWSVDFFPPVRCTSCGREFPNRKGLRYHFCWPYHDVTALDWDYDDVADAESEAGSEGGAFDNDGTWYSDEAWENTFDEDEDYWKVDEWGRSPIWHAAATGNVDLIFRLLGQDAEVDDKDYEGVTPMLAAVRLGQWLAAEALLCAGAFQMPWKLTIRRGSKWSDSKVSKFYKMVDAVKKGRGHIQTDTRFKLVFESRSASSKSQSTARFHGRDKPKGFACPECWITSRKWANMVLHIKATGHAGGMAKHMNDRARYAALERAAAVASGSWSEPVACAKVREVCDVESPALWTLAQDVHCTLQGRGGSIATDEINSVAKRHSRQIENAGQHNLLHSRTGPWLSKRFFSAFPTLFLVKDKQISAVPASGSSIGPQSQTEVSMSMPASHMPSRGASEDGSEVDVASTAKQLDPAAKFKAKHTELAKRLRAFIKAQGGELNIGRIQQFSEGDAVRKAGYGKMCEAFPELLKFDNRGQKGRFLCSRCRGGG